MFSRGTEDLSCVGSIQSEEEPEHNTGGERSLFNGKKQLRLAFLGRCVGGPRCPSRSVGPVEVSRHSLALLFIATNIVLTPTGPAERRNTTSTTG